MVDTDVDHFDVDHDGIACEECWRAVTADADKAWTLQVPGACSVRVERGSGCWWRCENPYEASGPGLGRSLLVRRRSGAWDLGWDGDVYSQRTGVQHLWDALNTLVAPSEPNRAWMGALIDLLNEHGLWPAREVWAELAQRRRRVHRRRLSPSEQDLLDGHGERGIGLARAAEEANLSIEQAREVWSRLEREAAWLAQWRETDRDPRHAVEEVDLAGSMPFDSFIVRDKEGRETFCPDRHSMLGETARLAGEPYWVSWKMSSGGMGYADGPLDHGWGTTHQAD